MRLGLSLSLSAVSSRAAASSGGSSVNALLTGNSNLGTDPTYNYGPMDDWLNALVTASSRADMTADSYWVGGYSFADHVADPLQLAKVEIGEWTVGVLQNISTGATAANLAAHLANGLLLADRHWDTDPNCKVVIFEWHAYAEESSNYPSVYTDAETMYQQVKAACEELMTHIQTERPSKAHLVSILKWGTFIRAFGGLLPVSHPSRLNFYAGDTVHSNENGTVAKAACLYTGLRGRDSTPFMNAACTAMSVTPALDAEWLATKAYRFVKFGVYPCLFTTNPASQSVEPSDDAVFTVVVSGSGSITYEWFRDGVLISGQTAATYTLVNASPGDDGAEITCQATNGEGTTTSAVAVLTVAAAMVPVWLNFAQTTGAVSNPASDGKHYNNILAAVGEVWPAANTTWALIDETGAASGLTLRVISVGVGSGSNNTGATGQLGLPDLVTQHSWYSPKDAPSVFRIEGLTVAQINRFSFGGWRNASPPRTTRIAYTGGNTGSASYDASTNLLALVSFDAAPDGSGHMSFSLEGIDPTTNQLGYISVLGVSTPP